MEKNRGTEKAVGLWSNHQRNGGFTLPEIMIAVVVLGIGFMAAASMQISAIHSNTFANHMTEASNMAQSRIDMLMALEYSLSYTDSDLMDDIACPGGAEPYTDINANGLWDFKEPYVDTNKNSVWDGAHREPKPRPGYTISWSVSGNTPAGPAKVVVVYVTSHHTQKTTILSCIKARQ